VNWGPVLKVGRIAGDDPLYISFHQFSAEVNEQADFDS
jgi:hypothetical protein